PFVRIPKSTLKKLEFYPVILPAVSLNDMMEDCVSELLGMSPEEKQRAEEVLRAYGKAFSELGAAGIARAYETNYLPASIAAHWASHPYKSVCVPPPDTKLQTLLATVLTQSQQVLGEERAQLLLGNLVTGKSSWAGLFSGRRDGPDGLYTVCVNPDHSDGLEYGEYCDGSGVGRVSHNRNELWLNLVSEPIASRFFAPWLEQLGITITAGHAHP
ncbi:MAG: hypothetical protein NT031_05075, partial [Planctomycetota bacterium]|nr:hypothetical protein [Planctomycetota bacterium]